MSCCIAWVLFSLLVEEFMLWLNGALLSYISLMGIGIMARITSCLFRQLASSGPAMTTASLCLRGFLAQ